MRLLGKTPDFRGPHGEHLPGSIAETRFLRIGGIDQWVMIRGENVENPVLILLHGGPGFSEAQLFRHYNAALEKHFTLVSWDQRGAGKSFTPDIPRASMNVEQFLSDLDELVDGVFARLGKKVALFGHSWGSALGVLYAARHPEKLTAYVGSGQIGDWAAGEAASYEIAIAEAEDAGDESGMEALRKIGPPPHTAEQLWIERTWLQRLEGQLSARALLKIGRVILGGTESSLIELPSAMRGFRFSLETMWPEVSHLNLLERAPALQVPVFFLLGRHDHWVPSPQSLAYFDLLAAPSKKLVWFEHSGHEPFVDEPEAFNKAMIELVRPSLVSQRSLTIAQS